MEIFLYIFLGYAIGYQTARSTKCEFSWKKSLLAAAVALAIALVAVWLTK